MIREVRKYTSALADEFNEVVKDFEKDTAGERSSWKEIGDGISGAAKSVTDTVRAARADAQGDAAIAQAGAIESVAPPPEVTIAHAPAQWREIPSPGTRAHANGAAPDRDAIP